MPNRKRSNPLHVPRSYFFSRSRTLCCIASRRNRSRSKRASRGTVSKTVSPPFLRRVSMYPPSLASTSIIINAASDGVAPALGAPKLDRLHVEPMRCVSRPVTPVPPVPRLFSATDRRRAPQRRAPQCRNRGTSTGAQSRCPSVRPPRAGDGASDQDRGSRGVEITVRNSNVVGCLNPAWLFHRVLGDARCSVRSMTSGKDANECIHVSASLVLWYFRVLLVFTATVVST